jgi:hypothetical protein
MSALHSFDAVCDYATCDKCRVIRPIGTGTRTGCTQCNRPDSH